MKIKLIKIRCYSIDVEIDGNKHTLMEGDDIDINCATGGHQKSISTEDDRIYRLVYALPDQDQA